jgi:hypothetical protein
MGEHSDDPSDANDLLLVIAGLADVAIAGVDDRVV